MTAHVDVEELQTTKSEKLLALVMTAFLLLAGLWAYQEIDDRIRTALPLRTHTAAERVALESRRIAQTQLFRTDSAVRRARSEVDFRREAYRTALDEGRKAPDLRDRYRAAVADYEQALRQRARAQRELAAAQPAAEAAERRIASDIGRRHRVQERLIFATRLSAAIVFIVASFLLLWRLRNRGSRYLPLAGAAVGFATIFAFVLAGDYLTDYFDLFELGILVLALLGVAVTFAAFWVLQRYIARRLPRRRVRKHECPFCGYPVAANERCEGCGRAVIAPCAHCERARRVGTPFCAHCGHAA